MCHVDDELSVGGRLNLTLALARGGHVTFDCGPNATILITRSHDVNTDVRIDGGAADRVLLDAGGRSLSMFRVTRPNLSLGLANITLARAVSPGRQNALATHLPGSVVELGGGSSDRLSIEAVEVRDSASPVYVGGGQLFVRNSRFQNNTGVAIDSRGSNDIADSSFIGNDTGLSIALRAGDAHLQTTLGGSVTFANQRMSAIRVGLGGRLASTGTQFTGNRGDVGAAIRIDGLADSVSLRKTLYEGNVAQQNGGAISVVRHPRSVAGRPNAGPVAVSLNNASFRDNSAATGAGGAIHADLGDGGTLVIAGGRFIGNVAAVDGGAVFIRPGGAFAMKNSLLKGNRAPRASALMLVRAGVNSRVTNTLVVANQAQPGGGAIVANEVDFFNVTIADNEGSGVADGRSSRDMRDVVAGAPRLRFHNTVVADNRPSNCAGALRADGNGASLQSPSRGACPGIEATAAAMLDTFFAPLPASPALGHGKLADCMGVPVGGFDVISQKRGIGGFCSIGAFEAAPTRRAEERGKLRHPVGQGQDPAQGSLHGP